MAIHNFIWNLAQDCNKNKRKKKESFPLSYLATLILYKFPSRELRASSISIANRILSGAVEEGHYCEWKKHGSNGMTQRDSPSPGGRAAIWLHWVRDMHAPLSNGKPGKWQTLASAGGDTHWKCFTAKWREPCKTFNIEETAGMAQRKRTKILSFGLPQPWQGWQLYFLKSVMDSDDFWKFSS